jgi:hypothetical protein
MKTQFNNLRVAVALALLMAGAAAFAQSNRLPGPQDYARFSSFITDRNIFDPNRTPHSYVPGQSHHTIHTHRNGAPGIQLVGTMSYEKGLFAFFSGNSSDLSQVLQVGGKLEDYTVTDIAVNSVRLESADKKDQSFLEVGDGLRQENGKWVFSKAGDLPAASGSEDSSASSNGGGAATPADSAAPAAPIVPTGEMSDVLKRLMEKRQKENQ